MRLTVALSCVLVALTATSTAQAKLLYQFKKHESTAITERKIHLNLKHTSYICNNGTGKVKQVHCAATRWLEKWLQKLTVPAIPHYAQWMCIHHYEGSWTDSGDPYWGGLQMDRGFMGTYGADFIARFHGYANVWPIWAQMEAAERAYRSRGFHPWPNTAHYCGYL